jgi:hypothetical protein
MANRLAAATSPYLLQHQDNPVDWQEWGDDAYAEARRRGVPVFLSVGYAAPATGQPVAAICLVLHNSFGRFYATRSGGSRCRCTALAGGAE